MPSIKHFIIPLLLMLATAAYVIIGAISTSPIFTLLPVGYVTILGLFAIAVMTMLCLYLLKDDTTTYINKELSHLMQEWDKTKKRESKYKEADLYDNCYFMYMNIYPNRGGEPVVNLARLLANADRYDAIATIRIAYSILDDELMDVCFGTLDTRINEFTEEKEVFFNPIERV